MQSQSNTTNAKKRKSTPASNRAIEKYDKNNYDHLLVRFRKDGENMRGHGVTKAALREAASKRGQSLNEYVLLAVSEAMKRDASNDQLTPALSRSPFSLILGCDNKKLCKDLESCLNHRLGGKDYVLIIGQDAGHIYKAILDNVYGLNVYNFPDIAKDITSIFLTILKRHFNAI